MRWRIAGVSTRDNSYWKAAMMCSFSLLLWLFQNRVACEKWSSADSLPNARHGLSVASVGRSVYALGGGLQPGHTNSTNEADALTLEER